MTALARLFRRRLPRRARRLASLRGEHLEPRALLATFTVTNLLNAGTGSLRWAITQANANAGADDIAFAVPGEISLCSALPVITDPVALDGSTAPGFTGAPVVTVNARGLAGLRFSAGSNGSSLTSLSIVRACGAGVTLDASDITLAGNFIGVLPNGVTAAGNTGPGVLVTSRGSGNQIGAEPSTSYAVTASVTAAAGGTLPVAGWQGLTTAGSPGQYLITGTTTNPNAAGQTAGLLYVGPLSGVGGTGYVMVMPNQSGQTTDGTTAYSADNLGNGQLRIVGTYSNTGSANELGFVFEGSVSGGNLVGTYTAIPQPNQFATWNIPHSTANGLVVGNYDGSTPQGNPSGGGLAYVYDAVNKVYLAPRMEYPNSSSTTAYGIWHNGGTSYTICGGYANSLINNLDDQRQPLSQALLVDFDSATQTFSNWKTFSYVPPAGGASVVTHFEGISGVQPGIYTLAATALVDGVPVAGFATVSRNADGSFGTMQWTDLTPPVTGGSPFADSVYGNAVVGIDPSNAGVNAYQATIVPGANLISGNRGDGVQILGNGNVVERNQIGTDVSGRFAVPNGGNGIVVTNRARGNLIGGTATGGNDPTNGVFVRPPQGNLISGNRANGVLVTGGATATTLSGNFVGTSASGNSALGNGADGVAIVGANGTSLLGTTLEQAPFVFYNVLSGNAGNGLRITNSNNTTVYANFTGTGADNATVVANAGSGILVNGTSATTTVGGVIPLGNVNSGNNRYGIELAGQASGFVAFNSFVGVVAFGGTAPNRLDGIRITATGGNNKIRTCIVAGNYCNGIVIGGNAAGVTVEDTASGTNTGISEAVPNYGSGILITDNAHDNVIGGFQPSIETTVHLSGNLRYGIEIAGRARNNRIFNSVIGAGFDPTNAIPNAFGGISLGSGTSGTVIGGANLFMANRVLFNGGAGITMTGSTGNRILSNEIRGNAGSGIVIAGTQSTMIGAVGNGNVISSNRLNGIQVSGNVKGTVIAANLIGGISGNGANGLLLNAATNLLVGGTADGAANTIVTNVGYGLLAVGSCSRTQVIRNLISGNTQGNVNLASSSGITYVP